MIETEEELLMRTKGNRIQKTAKKHQFTFHFGEISISKTFNISSNNKQVSRINNRKCYNIFLRCLFYQYLYIVLSRALLSLEMKRKIIENSQARHCYKCITKKIMFKDISSKSYTFNITCVPFHHLNNQIFPKKYSFK